MTVKAFLEVLKPDVTVILKESDNTTVATFSRDSYKVISDTYLSREIGDVELLVKSAVTVAVTLKELSTEG